jgi:hypothetical protein
VLACFSKQWNSAASPRILELQGALTGLGTGAILQPGLWGKRDVLPNLASLFLNAISAMMGSPELMSLKQNSSLLHPFATMVSMSRPFGLGGESTPEESNICN